MALEKIQVIDQIEVVGEYAVQVRQTTKVMENMVSGSGGTQIGSDSYHRHVVHPNHDWSNEDAKVKKICDALFDADCIEAYFVSQHGYPSGSASESWTKAQLQKYCDDRSIAYEESDTKAELITKIESV